jgi:hypothetical protein
MRLDLNQAARSAARLGQERDMAQQRESPVRFGDEKRRLGCSGDELRCGCGSLLARVVGGEVELKCRRCKRTWTIPLQGR